MRYVPPIAPGLEGSVDGNSSAAENSVVGSYSGPSSGTSGVSSYAVSGASTGIPNPSSRFSGKSLAGQGFAGTSHLKSWWTARRLPSIPDVVESVRRVRERNGVRRWGRRRERGRRRGRLDRMISGDSPEGRGKGSRRRPFWVALVVGMVATLFLHHEVVLPYFDPEHSRSGRRERRVNRRGHAEHAQKGGDVTVSDSLGTHAMPEHVVVALPGSESAEEFVSLVETSKEAKKETKKETKTEPAEAEADKTPKKSIKAESKRVATEPTKESTKELAEKKKEEKKAEKSEGAGEECKAENGEEGEGEEVKIPGLVYCGEIALVIILSLIFENGEDRLREKLQEEEREVPLDVMDAMLGELAILGFIGLLVYCVTKTPLADRLADWLFEDQGFKSKEGRNSEERMDFVSRKRGESRL